MPVTCPHCRATLHSADMDLGRLVGKCRACHSLVDLSPHVPAPANKPPAPRPKVPRPPKLRVDDSGPELVITRRWFSPVFLFLALFCVVWLSFLVFWYAMAFGMDAPWVFKLFPVLHVAVGVGLAYFTVAGFLNVTVIRAGPAELSVWHGPVPWRGNRRLPTDAVEHLYCQQSRHTGKHGVSFTFAVNAVTMDGRKVVLVQSLQDADQARFIEQAVEQHLGLPDRRVPGELAR